MSEEEESSDKGKATRTVAELIVAIVAIISLFMSCVQNDRLLDLEKRVFVADVQVLTVQSMATATISNSLIDVSGEEILRELQLRGIEPDFAPPEIINSEESRVSGSVELWVANRGARASTVVSIVFTPKLEPQNTLQSSTLLPEINGFFDEETELSLDPGPQFQVSFTEPVE